MPGDENYNPPEAVLAVEEAVRANQKATASSRGVNLSPAHAVDPSAPKPRKVSPGHIVMYNHPGSADGKYPPQQSPAIVQRLDENGDPILFVFGPKGQHMDGPYQEGDGPCQWSWPKID